jgi:hypothetical protein
VLQQKRYGEGSKEAAYQGDSTELLNRTKHPARQPNLRRQKVRDHAAYWRKKRSHTEAIPGLRTVIRITDY